MKRAVAASTAALALLGCGGGPSVQDAEAHAENTYAEEGLSVSNVYCREVGERFECQVTVKEPPLPAQTDNVYIEKSEVE